MTKSNFKKTQFLLSVANIQQLPSDNGIEVAIIGRSNAGKSSVLNQLTQNKHLARVSKTPGRTQLINIFSMDNNQRLVDLPGYGFAKVPFEVKQRWERLVGEYLHHRECLRGLILVMDIRHPLKESDRKFLIWSCQCDLPVHILLNKADKLSLHEIKKTLTLVNEVLLPHQALISFQIFSAKSGVGTEELHQKLNEWFSD